MSDKGSLLLKAAAKIPGPDPRQPVTLEQLRADLERLRTFKLSALAQQVEQEPEDGTR